MGFLLDALYLVAAAGVSPWLLRKRRGGWRERFGHVAAGPLTRPDRGRVLLHAVSVGEVNLSRGLVRALAEDFEVVVSVTTDTGIARAREVFEGQARVVRYPVDFTRCVRRFLDAVRPDFVGLVELEVWPNFLAECRRRGVPVAVLNGRLSDRSFARYRRLRWLLSGLFRNLAFVAAQDEVYARRFVEVGAPAQRVRTLGSMKWDSAAVADTGDLEAKSSALAREMGIDRSRPLIVAGSTAPDEHALLDAATPAGVQLLCAPRRPEWWDGAERDLPGCVRRTKVDRARPPAPGSHDRFLLDTIGELRGAYALADVVVVGRSFGALHGSDPMEPAAMGKAVVIGPASADFREAVETLGRADAIVRTTREGLAGELARLVGDARERAALGARARAVAEANRGATERHAALVREALGGTARPPRAYAMSGEA